MALTDIAIKTAIRDAKKSSKLAGDKYADGDGMYLLVKNTGSGVGTYWRMDYRINGRRKTLALGMYPEVSLLKARKRRAEAREQLAEGVDPGADKREKKRARITAAKQTFEVMARDWLKTSASDRGEKTQQRVESWFERDVFPFIGKKPIGELGPAEILDLMKRMEKRGIIDSMRRVLGYISKVFRLAMVAELIDRDPTVGVADQLEQRKEGHFAAITDPAAVAALLRAIHGYDGHSATLAALKLMPLVFQRPHMIREAEWSEFDLENAEWRVPAAKMKMENDHIVPLSTQAVAILRDLKPITGHGRFVFAGHRPGRYMSENTINAALRALGYSGDMMTGHGFRALARTILDEVLGERVDLIEHQLGHAVKDANGRAYNRTAHLPARRAMMQRWADYLDKLRAGADILKFGRGQDV